jgi:hypothetical protein
MKAIRMRIPLIAAAAIGLGAAVALVTVPAGAAVSLQSQSPPVAAISVGDTALLGAKGAVIYVPVSVTCPAGSIGFLSVQVAEKSGSGIASGGTGQEVNCTGSVQQLTVPITPNQEPFKKGVAFAQAYLSVCQFQCDTFTDAHNIQIVTK